MEFHGERRHHGGIMRLLVALRPHLPSFADACSKEMLMPRPECLAKLHFKLNRASAESCDRQTSFINSMYSTPLS